jgi:signal transduction histidine kinase/ActR/RegA family two-component response regulator
MTVLDAYLRRRRVVILAPTGKDAALTAAAFKEAAIESFVCTHVSCVDEALMEGAGVLLIAEEAIVGGGLDLVAAALSRQPPWSDLPVLLLTRYGADSAIVAKALQTMGNVTLLERPVRPATLLSSVRAALKTREWQYRVGGYLEEQKRTNAQLEESIQERARVEEALRDADRRKDEFLATLAHELRNPLAPIRNSLHILRLSSSSDPAAEQVCEMIERQVSYLVRLVDDLLEVSRITRGKVELRMEPVELAAVIRSAVEASRPLIQASQHQLAIALPPQPLILMGDPVRLTQIFANLLNNAAKYMNQGGQIWLSAKRENGNVSVCVRDTGIGITSEMLPHIFKMFTQVDRSKRQSQGGLGIGLTLVEMHGGKVEARSPGLDQGSEFVVSLPLSKDHFAVEKRAPETRVSVLPNRRVLVVDDNRDAAVSLGKLLGVLGAEVQVAHDGPSALAVVPTFRPNVVLLDIGMPGMNGYEVARRIREQPVGRNLMLIALTGWGQEQDRRLASEAGFDHHLLKPADVSALKSLFMSLETTDGERGMSEPCSGG